MPITASAKKALRRDRRRAIVNQQIKKQIKEILKKTRQKPTKTNLTRLACLLDRAAKKGVIHANKAARLKSRISKQAKKTK